MANVQWYGTYLPAQEIPKSSRLSTEIALETPPDDISIYIGALVDPARVDEIVNAWKFLYHGIKERNLLDGQFISFPLYTYVDIDEITANNRRTSSDMTGLQVTDVVLALGSSVTEYHDTTQLGTAIYGLIEFAMEDTLKVS